MAHENIRFTRDHMVLIDGYFYMFDETLSVLIKKASDGAVVFSYPVLDYIGSDIKSLEHDGQYFWTLHTGSNSTWDIVLKKWAIEDYFCVLKATKEFIYDGSNRYDSSSFTIEHYHTTFFTTISENSSYIYLTDYTNNSSIISPGTVLTLGPNSLGQYEDVTVINVVDEKVNLNFYTYYTYEVGDPINISKYIWLFNNYNGIDVIGALYKFDANTGNYLNRYDGLEYKDIKASTFSKIDMIKQFGEIYPVAYIKNNYLTFLDTSNNNVDIYCSMLLDNTQADGSTIIDVHDMSIYNGSIYRLQLRSNYYGNDHIWSTYNYQLSPIRNFIDSITLSIYPNVIPATGLNLAEAKAVVKDQYSEPIIFKLVSFNDDDPIGFMTITDILTDYNGVAISYYQSGVSIGTINITASVTQFD